jgi:hypothetical protein
MVLKKALYRKEKPPDLPEITASSSRYEFLQVFLFLLANFGLLPVDSDFESGSYPLNH